MVESFWWLSTAINDWQTDSGEVLNAVWPVAKALGGLPWPARHQPIVKMYASLVPFTLTHSLCGWHLATLAGSHLYPAITCVSKLTLLKNWLHIPLQILNGHVGLGHVLFNSRKAEMDTGFYKINPQMPTVLVCVCDVVKNKIHLVWNLKSYISHHITTPTWS